ncbi:MAG: cysteine--tRNA ligase, partial [Bdellovibrionales bacterium]|nr:cysteine--tRNA ligase [Bdellovibrionales bacterium]
FFNLVRNWFESKGLKVTYVYNYTDVDDKIIKRGQEEGVDPQLVAEKYIKEFEKDYQTLKLRPQSRNPRVTEFMSQIIQFIQDLLAAGKAYEVDGDVYYDVHAFKEYGKLSHKKLEDLEAGYRIEVDARKKHSADFALWKKAKPGEPKWPSPWSEGRPGWHIECSAMSRTLLGDTIDIHGGGMDLMFPHHENEIAQSEGATNKPFVRYWMHNNMLNFGNQKMSKSLGNVRTARSFLEQYNAEILKYMMLSVHYRSTSDFSEAAIDSAIAALARFYSAMAFAERLIQQDLPLVPVPEKFQTAIDHADEGIEKALDDDFNTPEVMARIYEVMRLFNNLCRVPGKVTPEKKAVAEVFFHWLKKKGQLMALFQEAPQEFLRRLDDMLLEKKGVRREDVDSLVKERGQAREIKDFKKADEVREKLTSLGIAVQDTATGSEWEVQKN